MEKQYFNDFQKFLNKVENLKKEESFFFADNKEMVIYINNLNEIFLDFYLNILVNVICNHNFNEVTSLQSTNWYFYFPKNKLESLKYSYRDIQIMSVKLGYNFDDYDQEFLDNVGVIY